MTKLKDLKIYQVSLDVEATNTLEDEFEGIANVFIYNADIRYFYEEHSDEIDCLGI